MINNRVLIFVLSIEEGQINKQISCESYHVIYRNSPKQRLSISVQYTNHLSDSTFDSDSKKLVQNDGIIVHQIPILFLYCLNYKLFVFQLTFTSNFS